MKKRKEAFLVQNIDPVFTVMMGIMPKRYDAENTTMLDIVCEGMDKYIEEKKQEGITYNYMHICIAAMARCMAMRPELNRFTSNYKMYERYKITVSFVVKRSLRDDALEQVVKLRLNGNETLEQIRALVDGEINKTLSEAELSNKTNKTASMISRLPGWVIKAVIGYLSWADRHNCLPSAIEEASPFHCSFFITNLKSIKTESINHHCYEFGTTSIFLALGRDKIVPMSGEGDEVLNKKIFRLGVSCDERICDGLYYGRSFHVIQKFLNNPTLLENEYHNEKIDAEIEKDKRAAELEAKKREKAELRHKRKAKQT